MAESRTNGKGLADTNPADDAGVALTRSEELAPSQKDSAQFDDGALSKGSAVGRYLVLERLGAGAMGVVYAAYDPELDRKIALKLLRPQPGRDDQRMRQARLVREAQAIAKVSHSNVVNIFDVGVHQQQVFLAMEYLGGGTLKQWVRAEKRSFRDVLNLFVEVGRGLASAHAEGLIHRDFKPDNVLLDRNGNAKVVDFGLVRLAEAMQASGSRSRDEARALHETESGSRPAAFDEAALTRTGALTGTPAYMAPEQFLGRAIDARTDQFAFCVALYEALYGERPFTGESLAKLAESVTRGRVRPAPESTAVPGWLRKVILRGLAVDPEQRYPNLTELLETLARDPVARLRRRVGIAAAVAVAAVVALTVQRRYEHRRAEFEQRITARLAEGGKAFGEAQALKARVQLLRSRSFALFDAHNRENGEQTWTEARAVSASFDAALERAQRAQETALAMDQSRSETRRLLAEVLFERAALAELEVRREDLARHLAALDTIDSGGEQRQRWRQPGSLSVRTTPAGAKVTIERFDSTAGPRITAQAGPMLPSPVASHALAPGSYRLRIEKAGHVETLYPFVIRRGEAVSVDIPLPTPGEIPDDFRFVPAGRFFYGDQDEELRLSFLNASPVHEREVGAFLIKSHETTFADWIEFLSSLPPKERLARMPASKAVAGMVALSQVGDGDWKLRLTVSNRPLEATRGQKFVYPGRPKATATQDWLKMPVVGVSPVDMRAYLRWLDTTKKVPGARFCREGEWERAARGADERGYPSSLVRLAATDANVDATYGRIPGAYGPDEVGRHPESRSPFGVDDMAGNVWEVVESDHAGGGFVARGGCYYEAFTSARSTNRELIEAELRNHTAGFRVCADWPKQLTGGANR